jgi:hypothetical protein
MKPMSGVYGIKEMMISLDRCYYRRNFTTLRTEKKPSCAKKSTKQT